MFVGVVTFGATYNVFQTSASPGVANSFAWALDQVRYSQGPHTINFTAAPGTVFDHSTGDPNNFKSVWTLSVNLTSGATAANMVTINGNGCILSNAGNPKNDAVHTLTIAGNFVTIDNLKFTGGDTKAPFGGNIFGSGVILADARSYDPAGVASSGAIAPTEIWGDVTFTNCEFYGNDGPGLSNTTYCQFYDAGCTCQVPNCTPDGEGTGIENLVLEDCDSYSNGLSGIALRKVDGFEVVRGSYKENGESGIQFQSNVSNGLISDVKAFRNGVPGLTPNTNGNNGAGIRFNQGNAPSSNIFIEKSEIYQNNIHGVEFAGAVSNSSVIDNVIYENGKGTVANPANGAQGAGVVMQFGGSSGNTVAYNDIRDNEDSGIYMYRIGANSDHSNNVFYDNDVTDNGGGIVVLSSSGSFIANNRITSLKAPSGNIIGAEEGIFFGDNSDNGVVIGNTINGASFGNGILITDRGVAATGNGSDNVFILNNTIQDASTTSSGIRVENSNDSHIGDATSAPTVTRLVNGYATININPSGVLQNSISGTTVHAIDMFNSDGVDINGAFIGTSDGVSLGTNTGNGINLDQCTGVEIGTQQRNIISGSPNGYGIYATASDNIQIDNNYIGTDLNGTTALANGKAGIFLGATNNSNIGSSGRNIISGNLSNGIEVSNNATQVTIESNYIGLDVNGTAILGNDGDGINMTGANTNSVIDNYVSGNTRHGIYVQSAATTTNTIQRNYIGVKTDGSDGGNGDDGIHLDACKLNTIGGTVGNGNIIGFNGGDGVSLNGVDTDDNIIGDTLIGIDASDNLIPNGANGVYIASTATSNEIGVNALGTSAGNIISGNAKNGIIIDGSNNNQIDGNIIGMNSLKTIVLPNGAAFSGVQITGAGAKDNIIGDVERNFIAGPHTQQILIDGGANNNIVKNVTLGDQALGATAQASGNAILITGTGTDDNIVGGVIGTDENFVYHSNNVAVLINTQAARNTVKSNIFESVGGTSPISAIQVNNGNGNIIGGAAADQGNVIATTSSDAIVVDGISDGNQVQFNYIGVDQNEASVGPIKGNGILLDGGGVSNTIVNQNVIGNIDDASNAGIFIDGVSAISTLYGNYVGITRGDIAIANEGHGIWVTGTSDQVSVGTAGVGKDPNIISNNKLNGVEIDNSTTSTVINNRIGTNVAGDAGISTFGNGQNGVHVGIGNTGVIIDQNLIAENDLNGVLVDNDVTGAVVISANTINANGTAVIDHGVNVTAGTGSLTISGNGIGVQTGNLLTDGNTGNGVYITGFTGTGLIENNVIGGNQFGIELNGADNVNIDGNHIGKSDLATTDNLGNVKDGIYAYGGSQALTINGNAIGFNGENGIELNGVSGANISDNKIGVDVSNSNNPMANTLNGILLASGSNNAIITGNTIGLQTEALSAAITIDDSSGAILTGNILGTDTAGSTVDLGNRIGVLIQKNGFSNQIGDATLANANTIAFSTAMGISISGDLSINNSIRGNSLYCNADGSDVIKTPTTSLQGNGTGISLSFLGNANYGLTLSAAYNDNSGNPQIATTFRNYPPLLDGTTLSVSDLEELNGGRVDVYSNDVNCDNCQGLTYDAAASIGTISGGIWSTTVSDASATYVIIVTSVSGNSTEHSGCNVLQTCDLPYANFDVTIPEFTLTAVTNPEGSMAFCEDGDYDLILDPAQKPGYSETLEYGWYQVADPTTFDFTTHDTTVRGIPGTGFTDLFQVSQTLNVSQTGYYMFYVNVVGDPTCGVPSEIVKVQEYLKPTPVIVGEDEVCEDDLAETYTASVGTTFEAFAQKFSLTTTTSWGATDATANGGPAGTNDYSGPTYDTQDFDFAATNATLTLDEEYDIVTNTISALTATCSGTQASKSVSVQIFPTLTSVSDYEICDDASSNAVALTSTPASTGYVWSALATGASGNTAAGTSANIPGEQLTLADPVVAGTVVYTAYGQIEITLNDGIAKRVCQDPTLTESYTVTVQPLPTEPTPTSSDACVGDQLDLSTYGTTTVQVAPTSYAWTGSNNFSVADPSIVTAATTDGGNYTVTVTTVYPGIALGCTASESVLATINALPTPSIIGDKNGAPCPNGLEVYTLSGVAATPFTTVWDVSDLTPPPVSDAPGTNPNTTYNVTHATSGGGDIEATVTDNNGCVNSTTYAVTVLGTPSVTLATSGVCETDNQIFRATATPTASYTYTWYKGSPSTGTPISGAPNANEYAAPSSVHSSGDNIYVGIVPTNCPTTPEAASPARSIDFKSVPVAAISGDNVVCVGEPVTLIASAANVSSPSYSWETPSSNSAAGQSYTFDPAENGTYVLTVRNEDAPSGTCVATDSYDVSVITVDVSAYASQTDVDEGTEVTIGATPTIYSSYSWITDEGVNKGSAITFTDTPLEATTYTVTATEGNCEASADVTVNVRALVVVPSMFTPGNADNLNDVWILTNIEGYPEAIIKVYNRWGNIIYEGPGGPEYTANPWNGTKGGAELPAAVYYYVIELNYNDISLAGSVTIMR